MQKCVLRAFVDSEGPDQTVQMLQNVRTESKGLDDTLCTCSMI